MRSIPEDHLSEFPSESGVALCMAREASYSSGLTSERVDEHGKVIEFKLRRSSSTSQAFSQQNACRGSLVVVVVVVVVVVSSGDQTQ